MRDARACSARRASPWPSAAWSASSPTGRRRRAPAEPPAIAAADRQARRRRRLRPGRPHRRRRPGPARPRGHHLRGPARGRRRADLRHPGVPPAQGHRRAARSSTCRAWASSCASTSSSARRAPSTASLSEFDAVFVGAGAGLPWFLDIPGENLNGVYSANEYLTRCNLMHGFRFPAYDTPLKRARRVAVFGGGNVAMDSARTALRLGADEVHIVYRRSRDGAAGPRRGGRERRGGGRHLRLPDPARAPHRRRARLAHRDRVPAHGAGRARRLRPPPAGARSPAPSSSCSVDAVVCAIGNSPNPLIPTTTPGLEVGKQGNIVADEATGTHLARPASGPAATSSPARPR